MGANDTIASNPAAAARRVKVISVVLLEPRSYREMDVADTPVGLASRSWVNPARRQSSLTMFTWQYLDRSNERFKGSLLALPRHSSGMR